MGIHYIIFAILSIVVLVLLGNEFKEVCKLEKGYMEEVEFVTWGNDANCKEVTK
jgi:hypothetical protein